MVEGCAAGLAAHRERFVSSCVRHAPGLGVAAVETAWSGFLAQIPRRGDLFPRIQFDTGTGEFGQVLRPAPVRPPTATFWCAPPGDLRSQPGTKGPDLDLLAGLRARAEAVGAQEALILAPDGTVVEGAYTAVVWWEGATLCVRDEGVSRLPSVTEGRLLDLCRQRGIPVRGGRLAAERLPDHETWVVNSLDQVRLLVPGRIGGVDPGGDVVGDGPVFSARFRELSAALWAGWPALPG
ncbi:hypothetical protein AUCHE_16_00240 [Austwickia chelonae NBRC 105200]|uniref:Aminotransferase n=1 Tax=Austwickia chelonae NBRC 105200 TaxID=1184607 RepID=K6V8R4_9MICO|nr:hypothetical protein AUCHE_16_00240 [Austwickia chelonae NBRC 105200]